MVSRNAGTTSAVRPSAHPAYVTAALAGLTRTQKRYVLDGCIHGDCTMQTARALRQKALFYVHPTSPNGRCGAMRLTPLGETVRLILRARASSGSTAVAAQVSQPIREALKPSSTEGEET